MRRFWTYAGLILTVIFWGASFIATKIVLLELTPATIVVIRFGVGFLVLLIAGGFGQEIKPVHRRKLPFLALLGFLGITFHQWLQVTGLKSTAATITAWVVATTPVFVALLDWAILGERLSKRQVAGIALAAGGAVTVVSGGDLLALTSYRVGTVGDFMITISAVNWAVFTVLSKHVLGRLSPDDYKEGEVNGSPITAMIYVMGFGLAFCLPWAWVDGGWRDLAAMSEQGWWALIFLGVACSGLAYLFWFKALDVMPAARAGVFLYLEPLVTSVLAGPMLGESIDNRHCVGWGCDLTGCVVGESGLRIRGAVWSNGWQWEGG